MTTGFPTPFKIVVLISGNGSNLQALISAMDHGLPSIPFGFQGTGKALVGEDEGVYTEYMTESESHEQHNQNLTGEGYKVVLVVSNRPDAYGLERARRANIPTMVIDHHDFENRESFDRALLQCLRTSAPDLIVLAGFMRILSPIVVDAFPNQIINIHPSLLPKYPGLHTHRQVLDNGDSIHGSSVHLVTEGLDSGPIIAQASFAVAATDNEITLQNKIHAVEHQLYPYVVELIARGRLKIYSNCITLDGNPLPPQGLYYSCQEHETNGQI